MASRRTTWSDLPRDLLEIACRKLTVIFDFAAFAAVCSHWRIASVLCKPPQVPVLLMFPESSMIKHTVFSCLDVRKYVLHMKQLFLRCHGSGHGWLITRDFYDKSLLLLNPFLSVKNIIQLPCPGRERYIIKAVLSNDPSKTSNYSVAVLYLYGSRLAFFRAGDTHWRFVEGDFQDIAYYKDQLYVLNRGDYLVSCNIRAPLPLLTIVAKLEYTGSHAAYKYLVVSEGDLLCVTLLTKDKFDTEIIGCQVFEFGTRKCEKLKNLGGRAVFLSRISCVSLSASALALANCKPDHVYFMIQNSMGRNERIEFNLIGETIHRLQLEEFNPISVWFQPTLNEVTSTNHN